MPNILAPDYIFYLVIEFSAVCFIPWTVDFVKTTANYQSCDFILESTLGNLNCDLITFAHTQHVPQHVRPDRLTRSHTMAFVHFAKAVIITSLKCFNGTKLTTDCVLMNSCVLVCAWSWCICFCSHESEDCCT